MKVQHAVLGLAATFGIALTLSSCGGGQGSGSSNPIKASSQSFTFDRTTEVHDNGNGKDFTVPRGPGEDDDLLLQLDFYHSSEPYYMERTTPHYLGKHDSEDDYFLFCDDLQKDEGFKLIINGLYNITSFSLRWYLSDNNDDNACDVIWRASTYHAGTIERLLYERVNYSNRTTTTAGQEGSATFSRSDITYSDDPVNYITIECKHNRYGSTFRLRSITVNWSC